MESAGGTANNGKPVILWLYDHTIYTSFNESDKTFQQIIEKEEL